MKKVSFTEMKNGTKDDYKLLEKLESQYERKTADRILDYLASQTTTLEGYQITRLEHSLQAATRAYKNGESEEMIVATLLHDLGDELAPMNHSQYAASVIKPYVSEKTYWIILHHGLFQTYYSAEHLGGDKNAREKYKDAEHYQATIDFCEKYDQSSFDPNYKSMSLKDFEPMVRNIFFKKTLLPSLNCLIF
jgi:predicted HD phosphohydrolase